jgi:hypothetical protein
MASEAEHERLAAKRLSALKVCLVQVPCWRRAADELKCTDDVAGTEETVHCHSIVHSGVF